MQLDQQGRHRRHPLFRRQAGDRRQPDGRRAGRLQHAGRPGQRAGAAAGADLAGFPPGPPLGRSGSATSSTRTAEPTYIAGAHALPAIRGDIPFEHVTFRYRIDGQQVLHDVTFDVPAGQVVGIVGPSGSGKSTLAKLVQRLYVPESGRVLVDGVDLAMVDPAWLRRQIGVVLQENVLFNRSVRENIALADPAMPIERVDRGGEARRRARVHPRTARGLRHHRRRARRHPVGRPAPAHRDRPRAGHRPAHPDLRRGDQRARLRERAHHPAEHAADRQGAHRARSSRTGCRRCARPIASSPSSAAASSRTARTTTLIKTGGRYATLHRLQAGIHEVG